MNRLSLARRTQVISCLVEGNSIRSTERMTDAHRDTIMRLMVDVGTGCSALANEQMRNLPCQRMRITPAMAANVADIDYIAEKSPVLPMYLRRGMATLKTKPSD
jgi:hypothetical protein